MVGSAGGRAREELEAEQRAAELEQQLADERVEQLRQQIIEEERRRMIANHAKNLGLQHLPRGILENADDLALYRVDGGRLTADVSGMKAP